MEVIIIKIKVLLIKLNKVTFIRKGFAEQMNVSVTSPSNPNATNPRAFPEDMKHLPIAKQVRPPGQFPENPFVPRGMHTIYRYDQIMVICIC